jgi:spore photoproduct lyase
MISCRPEQVLVQTESWEDELTRQVLERLPEVRVRTITHPDSVLEEMNRSSDPHTSGKRTLILARHAGNFLKECPGAGAEICCNYYVVNYASNCHLECTYCVLQTYLNNPALIVFTNSRNLLAEVAGMLARSPRQIFRIGTGELADSLALDDITGYSRLLVPFFGSLPNGILELKTKSDRVSNLKALDHRDHTVVSWSLNSKPICRSEELKTASFQERLAAAGLCQGWGYRVGFHFDPLIYYDGWEKDYEEAVRETFRAVDAARVVWVSLGCLRFTRHLQDLVRARFPKSKIPYGEFVPGHHGKLRYFRPIREEMYAKMRGWIQEAAPGVFVYLCMENRAVWEEGMGGSPENTGALSNQMDALVQISIDRRPQ